MSLIRPFKSDDLPILKEITAICFDGVSIDQNIEQRFGSINQHDWRWRKVRHIDNDAIADPTGIFVAEMEGRLVGFVTTRIDHAAKVGSIANLAVLPDYQQHGLGHQLIEQAVAYARNVGMEILRIETMTQNDVGTKFYPKMGFEEVARQVHYAMDLRPSE